MKTNSIRLRRLVDTAVVGTWGTEPGGDEMDIACVRAADFDYEHLLVDRGRLPIRSVSVREFQAKSLRNGDLVLEKSGGGELQPVGRVVRWTHDIPAVCSNFAARIRPTARVCSRYLSYLLDSMYGSGVTRRSVKQTTGIQNLDFSAYLDEVVPLPAINDQQSIVRFLDGETARIDALIAKKTAMATLTRQRMGAARDEMIWVDDGRLVPLMRLVDQKRPIMYGIVLPGPDVDEGVYIVKGGDVAADFGRVLCRTTYEIESGYARSRLKAGDLVFSIRGGIGDVARVPELADGANMTQDVARVSPGQDVEVDWLFHVLRSPRFQAQAASRITGATIRGINIWDLERLMIPDVSTRVQISIAHRLNDIQRRIDAVVDRLNLQIGLLKEHRQTLITAAVSGEMEVSGVS